MVNKELRKLQPVGDAVTRNMFFRADEIRSLLPNVSVNSNIYGKTEIEQRGEEKVIVVHLQVQSE